MTNSMRSSGNWRPKECGGEVKYEFCPSCATTLSWHVDIVPQRQAFAGGAFDDMKGLKLIAEMYADDQFLGRMSIALCRVLERRTTTSAAR